MSKFRDFRWRINQRVNSWWETGAVEERGIFHSARLKLTAFYLIVFVALSLVLTLSIRGLAEREFSNAGAGERGAVRRLIYDLYSVPPPQPDNDFARYQSKQENAIRRHLNDDVIIVNLAALVFGGLLCYWYAGRTLHPIEEAHKAQARFAADASHELRTPLASLKVENEVFLHQKDFTKEEAREIVQSNLEEIQRLESLAGNLLALTQYENASLERTAVGVRQLVDVAVEQMTKQAQAKAVVFNSTKLGDANIRVHFDSAVQLLSIVLENAVKYGPAKGTVYIAGKRHGNQYDMVIRDEGPGIAAEDLPHIFERLYRGDKARTGGAGGYGLGLSLAQQIAWANSISIDADNAAAGGAAFTLTFEMV